MSKIMRHLEFMELDRCKIVNGIKVFILRTMNDHIVHSQLFEQTLKPSVHSYVSLTVPFKQFPAKKPICKLFLLPETPVFAEEVKEDVKEEPPKGALASLLRGEKPEVKAQVEAAKVEREGGCP